MTSSKKLRTPIQHHRRGQRHGRGRSRGEGVTVAAILDRTFYILMSQQFVTRNSAITQHSYTTSVSQPRHETEQLTLLSGT